MHTNRCQIVTEANFGQHIGHRFDDFQQQFTTQIVDFWQTRHLRVVSHNHAQCVFFDVGHIHFVRCLQYLEHILYVNVVLEIVFAERL